MCNKRIIADRMGKHPGYAWNVYKCEQKGSSNWLELGLSLGNENAETFRRAQQIVLDWRIS
ncbi:hypothetical protein [Phocaeicola plebeius]|uniref:hypothetical protein n=1 Tax=Phocaeicola plebeius TaxID=310297 RepID=UPI003AB355B2